MYICLEEYCLVLVHVCFREHKRQLKLRNKMQTDSQLIQYISLLILIVFAKSEGKVAKMCIFAGKTK